MRDEEVKKLLTKALPAAQTKPVSKEFLMSHHLEVFKKMGWEHGPRCFKLCPKKKG